MSSMTMTPSLPFARPPRPVSLAVVAGLACAFVIGKALPTPMDAISAVIAPLCASANAASPLDKVEIITSHALPTCRASALRWCAYSTGPAASRRRIAIPAR